MRGFIFVIVLLLFHFTLGQIFDNYAEVETALNKKSKQSFTTLNKRDARPYDSDRYL